MDKSRYRYSRVQGKQEIHRLITPSDLKMIHSIDREFLEEILVTQKPLKTDVGGWHGRCPFCDGTRKRRKSQDSYRPAYIRPREQGYVFHCWSCDSILTTYKLIERVFGEEKAQEYALRRWEAGELCGGVGIVRYPKASGSASWMPRRSVVKRIGESMRRGACSTIRRSTFLKKSDPDASAFWKEARGEIDHPSRF